MNKMHTCCFFGHRKISETKELKSKLYDKTNAPATRKSGTKIALDYAVRQGKQIIVLPIRKTEKAFTSH